MSYLLIVSNTPSENTRLLYEAVVSGGQLSDFPIKAIPPLQATADDVLHASGVILGTTENFGYMSGQVKDFLERVYYPCLDLTQGLPWALYVSAGQDGAGAVSSVQRIITGLRWREVQQPVIFKSPFQHAYLEQCKELGQAMAIALQDKIF